MKKRTVVLIVSYRKETFTFNADCTLVTATIIPLCQKKSEPPFIFRRLNDAFVFFLSSNVKKRPCFLNQAIHDLGYIAHTRGS